MTRARAAELSVLGAILAAQAVLFARPLRSATNYDEDVYLAALDALRHGQALGSQVFAAQFPGFVYVAPKFEVHEMSMDNGVMRMRPLKDGLEIKPGETVELKPQGLHAMFVGLKKPVKQGDHIKATLVFEKAGKVDVDFDVTGMGGPAGHDMPAPKSGHDMPGMKM